jgi:hypothetical protein
MSELGVRQKRWTCHTLHIRDVSGISLRMCARFVQGVFLLRVCGLLVGAGPVVTAHAVALALTATTFVMKLGC